MLERYSYRREPSADTGNSAFSHYTSAAAGTVAGLRYHGSARHTFPLHPLDQTKSGSYIYDGSPSGYHDWAFRTRARIMQHQAKLRREAAKEAKASEKAQSRAPSLKMNSLPASPSSAHPAGRARPLVNGDEASVIEEGIPARDASVPTGS